MVEKYIEQLKPRVLEVFGEDSSGHDISHLERTKNIALFLQSKEGGDEIIVGIAAFLHDVHRIMQNKLGRFVSPKESLVEVKKILDTINLEENQVKQILCCIEYHEEYNWNNPDNQKKDINILLLQDADNMDAIGAIGVGRTFAYGGANKIPMYDENASLKDLEDYAEENGDDDSTIQHFYHKLFRLGDNMNTNTAKEMAKSRIDFMKNFVIEFLDEWNGKK